MEIIIIIIIIIIGVTERCRATLGMFYLDRCDRAMSCDTGYALPGVRNGKNYSMRDQRPWWRYALYRVPF